MRGKAARKEKEEGGIKGTLIYTLEYLIARASLPCCAQRICPYAVKVLLFLKFTIANNKARYHVEM